MCGIAGIVHLDAAPVDADVLAAMAQALAHRGPDGDGIRIDGPVGLAHRRLSIIDLAAGTQPLGNEDGTVWVTYNGEIYNHAALRAQLEATGHVFRTRCDTEVLVHLYEEVGPEFVRHLNGMFAFALWDSRRRRLILARDRLGQKPLFYFRTPRRLAFASELHALARHPDLPRDFDLQAVHDYLSLQYIPAPHTVYRHARKLPPAHSLDLDLDTGNARLQSYWHCRFDHKTRLSYADAREHLRELLTDAVRCRLMADVPLGAFLSGGLDSTLVVGLMAKICQQPVNTFTVGFPEAAYDERRFARIAAKRFATNHRERMVEPADFDTLTHLVQHFGEPFCDASMLPTFLLSQFTREHVTVALSGDGADEIFAGYYRYLVLKYAACADILPARLRRILWRHLAKLLPPTTDERTFIGKTRRILAMAAASPEERYYGLIARFRGDAKRAVYGPRLRDANIAPTRHLPHALLAGATANNPVEQLMEMELQSYLPGDILTKVDIASMACSLEVRSPFLDYRVAEFAAALPRTWKQRGLTRKRILLDTFPDLVPADIRRREKLGFGVPIATWLRHDWHQLAKERLLDGQATATGFFDRTAIENLLREHANHLADHSYPLWAMLIFELWLENTQ
jgi:asparagine synthase (glutamine-hydrolysing)